MHDRALHQAVGSALESGVCLYQTSWAAARRDDRELSQAVLDWCRATLANMHRPYGVDSVSLALLAHDQRRRTLASARFALLRPGDFYGAGQAEQETRDLLQGWHGAGILSRRGARLTAYLFSWGDFTQNLVQAG